VIAKYHQLPEWVRWILFLPLTLLITAAVCESVAWIGGRHYFVIRQVVAINCFMVMIYVLAPRWWTQFALAVLFIRMAFFTGAMAIVLARGTQLHEGLWIDLGRELLGWLVAWALYLALVFRVRLRPQ
jgi:hypothetical protein